MKQELKFKVSYADNETVKEKIFDNLEDANKAYNQIKKVNPGFPRKLESIGKTPILLYSSRWGISQYKIANVAAWKADAESRLLNAGLNHARVSLVLSAENLENIVVSNSVEKLTDIKGIGVTTAKKAIFALRDICHASGVEQRPMVEFIRVQLNNAVGESEISVDRIRKYSSPIEDKAIALGGGDAIIHVVSWINDPKKDDIDGRNWAEHLADYYRDICHNGLWINGKKYVPFGHGTNAAKECKTLWVLETIYEQLKKWADQGVQEGWKTTVAKRFAYMVGLKSVPTKLCGIPFLPEDFCILPSVIDKMTVNTTKLLLTNQAEDIDNAEIEVNRSDGYFMIDITPEMQAVLYNRMLARGDDPNEADRILRKFINDLTPNSYRAHPIALKGFGDKAIDFHSFLADNGVTHTPDGRPLRDICFLVDETVVKTSIGETGAYKTFADWCASCGEIDLGVCVQGHKKAKKNVSYQVSQSLCGASGETVKAMARPTVDLINRMHTISGASAALGRGMGTILKKFPELANVRNVKERIGRVISKNIDDAFGGKLLKCSNYAFITPDPIYVLQGWFGLERTGCLESGQFHVGKVNQRELATWRSPVVHPNSIRVVENVPIAKYRKYFKSDEFVIRMNSKDDVALAMDADWDGDHAFVSSDPALIQAAKETLADWNRLITWETPKTPKIVVTREDELEYFSNLTHGNELGLTVYNLNALLNGIRKFVDPVTKTETYKAVPISKRGVDFKKFAANVLVDASKHGGTTIAEPKESADAKYMIQPWAKDYRDAALKRIDTANKTKKQIDDEIAMKRVELDEMAVYRNLNKDHMKNVLNRLYAYFALHIDRSLEIVDAPASEFDFHKIMYDPSEGYRGLSGLIRKGEMGKVQIDGFWMRPDQGLFDSIARRIERDRRDWNASDRKDKEDTSFEEDWRTNALAEIQAYAEALGRTLKDAYDVITWQMFKYIDKLYASMDGSGDYTRDSLWKAYWLVFGDMAAEAAMKDEILAESETDDADEDESWYADEDALDVADDD